MSESQNQAEPITIETDQPELTLVQMLTEVDDAAYFALQNANLDYWKEFGNAIDESEEDVTKRRKEKSGPRFGIYKDGVLIGMEGYTLNQDGDAEVGIMLAEDATGHGYATSAVKALSAFLAPQFDRVFAEVDPENMGSISLLERTGYERVGDEVLRDWGRALVFESSGNNSKPRKLIGKSSDCIRV